MIEFGLSVAFMWGQNVGVGVSKGISMGLLLSKSIMVT